MTKPTTINASKLAIFLGDGASPEVFTAPCGLRARTFSFVTNVGESVIVDCTNPDAPPWKELVEQSKEMTVTGRGVLAKEAFATWRTWALSGGTKHSRMGVDKDVTGYFAGGFKLTQFQIAGEVGAGDGKVTVDLTLRSDGEVTWVAAP